MKITSLKELAPLIAIIIAAIVIGTGIIVYQSSKTRNEGTTVLTSTTITIPTPPTTFCLDWDFFKDPKNYDDGNSHDEIKIIQEKLGVTPVGGHYGSLTKAAIDKFNKDYNVIIPESGCCGNVIPAHLASGLTDLTIAKFNDLYCSLPKPKITVTIINYPEPKQMMDYVSVNGIKIEPSGNDTTIKTIEISYSGKIEIPNEFSSVFSLYDNDVLVFKSGVNGGGETYNNLASHNIMYTASGDSWFSWYNITQDRNIKFEFGK